MLTLGTHSEASVPSLVERLRVGGARSGLGALAYHSLWSMRHEAWPGTLWSWKIPSEYLCWAELGQDELARLMEGRVWRKLQDQDGASHKDSTSLASYILEGSHLLLEIALVVCIMERRQPHASSTT